MIGDLFFIELYNISLGMKNKLFSGKPLALAPLNVAINNTNIE